MHIILFYAQRPSLIRFPFLLLPEMVVLIKGAKPFQNQSSMQNAEILNIA